MSINSIKDAFVSSASQAWTGIKNFVSWSGHKIASGWNNYIVPFVTKIWNSTLPFLKSIWTFLQTGFGLAGLGVLSAIALHSIGEKYFANSASRHVITAVAFAVIFTAGCVAATFGAGPVVFA